MATLALGGVGGVSALANALPDEVATLQELYEKGSSTIMQT